ncbi:hypothetical protein [Dactylosporangium sp. CA-233914]|uniref:hypothetical protein n=1 Tax=Dactylosporangium sp. CA-233914 TaxID=3239934 RepID=UPI003D8B8157
MLAIFRSRGRLFITDSGSMNRLTYVASSARPATIGPTGEMRRVAIRPMSRPAPSRYAAGTIRSAESKAPRSTHFDTVSADFC